MSVTQGLTGTNQTVGASEEQFFAVADGLGVGAPTTIVVRNRGTSPTSAVIRIPALHGSSGGVAISPGEKEYFRFNDGELRSGYVTGNGCIIDWGPVASTRY